MENKLFKANRTRTKFVEIDTGKCNACWECLETCNNNVIGKIDLPWHKHAVFTNHDECNGCQKCVNTCKYGAYSIIDRNTIEFNLKKRKNVIDFVINNLLILFGLAMIFSGLTLQIGYHIGRDSNTNTHNNHYNNQAEHLIDQNKLVLGFKYTEWSDIHKITIVIFTMLMFYHFYSHFKWYNAIICKRLIYKNIQIITLSVLFVIVAITGFVPWITNLFAANSNIRMLFIELHDKIALILTVYLILHLAKRLKWYNTVFQKISKSRVEKKYS